MITTRTELLDIVKKDIEEHGDDEIVLTFIMTDEILRDGRLFHTDQVFKKDELIKIFAAVTNLIEVPINNERYIKTIQSLCANRMKTEYEIRKEKENFKYMVDTILEAWIDGETILRKEAGLNFEEWQDIKDIPEGGVIWDFSNYQFKVEPKQQPKSNFEMVMENLPEDKSELKDEIRNEEL